MAQAPDLASMMKYSPSMASGFAGQGQAMYMAQQQEDLRRQQLENQQASVMNPLNAQFKQNQIATQNAELPGIQGTSQSLAAKGQMDKDTMSQMIAAKISALGVNMNEDQMKQMGMDGQRLASIGGAISSLPDAAKPAAFMQAWQKYGGDPNSTTAQALSQVPPDKLSDTLQGMGKGFALASADYQQKKALQEIAQAQQEKIENMKSSTGLQEALIHERASKEVAKISGESRIQAAEARAQAMESRLNLQNRIGNILSTPNWAKDPAKVAEYTSLMRSAATLANANNGGNLQASIVGTQTPDQRTEDIIRQTIAANGGSAGTGSPVSNPVAPPEAEAYLKQHPELKDQFKAKYGYIPNGI